MRLRAFIACLLVFGALTATALAATGTIATKQRVFKLKAAKTSRFTVAYPDALEFGTAQYSGRVQILGPARGSHGAKPVLAKVHVLSKGSCLGGSDFCVRVRNGNAGGTAAVRVRITATTRLPCLHTNACPLDANR